MNAGTRAAILGDFQVADADADGAPRLDQVLTIPEGTAVVPGAYLFILANLGNDAESGWQTGCLDGGPSPCLQVDWGISQQDGETLTLLDAGGVVVARVRYPADAVADDESWARLPDATGEFGRAQPTPGRPNTP